MSEMVEIETLGSGRHFGAFLVRPKTPPKAAIIVIQEIFGVNAGIRRKCENWAEKGYLAIAPDLFWRINKDTDLDPDIEEQFNQAIELMNQFDQDAGIRDIEATIHWVRNKAGIKSVGCVGYCLGGRLAFMTAARTDIDASVGYYAVGIDGLLGEKHAIANPLMLHIPTNDGFVDAATQKAMHEGLDDDPKVVLYDYPGLDHGFATEFGKRRNPQAADLADRRTAEFFAEHLG